MAPTPPPKNPLNEEERRRLRTERLHFWSFVVAILTLLVGICAWLYPFSPRPIAPSNPTTAVPVNPTTVAPTHPITTVPLNPTTIVQPNPVTTASVNPTTASPANPITIVSSNPTAIISTTATIPASPTAAGPSQPTATVTSKPTATAPTEPTATAPTEPTATAPTEPTATAPTEPTATAPTEPTVAITSDGVINVTERFQTMQPAMPLGQIQQVEVPSDSIRSLLAGKSITVCVHVNKSGLALIKSIIHPPGTPTLLIRQVIREVGRTQWRVAVDDRGNISEDEIRIFFSCNPGGCLNIVPRYENAVCAPKMVE
jgi:cytoskeletal protein RodZ